MDIAFIAQSLWIALMEFVVMMISKANYLFKLHFKIFLTVYHQNIEYSNVFIF